MLVAGSTSAIRVVKTKAQLQAALPSSGDILIAGTVTIDEPLAVSGVARLWIYGGGKLQFTSAGSITFASCDDLSVDGVKFGGWIAQTDQYSVFKTGVHGDFASPSYNNGASAVDGSDFSHSLVGSMLTLSLGAAFWNALTTRNVVSSMISLDPTKRYVIDIKAGFYSGDGGNGVQFTTYDAGGAEIGEYAPADSSSYYSVISGASGMKVRVGVTSWYNTALDLSCVYDLSKIVIYKIENDLAAFSLATPTEDSSPILISNSKRPIIRDCQFDLIPAAAAIFVGCVDVEASGNTVTRCFGGISATTSTGKTKIVGNKIDLRFGVVGGGSLGQRFLRTHGVQASGSSDVEASRNTINGASWGIEILHYNDAYRHDVVGNTIEAEYCGISGVSGGWTAQFPNIIKSNTVKVSGSAIMGIEAAIGAAQGVRSVIEDNTVLWNDLCQFGAGVALSAGSQNFDVRVRRNTIFAPIGVNATAGIGTMEASKNNIRHAGRGISSFVQASFIDDNEIYTAKNTWLLAAHAAIHISAYTYYIGSEITKNKYDDTISLSGWVEGTAFFDWRGNKIYERYARTGDMTHHRFEVISNPYATKAQYSGNEIMYGSLCPDRVINNLYTGSVFEVSGNKYGGLAHDVLVGFHNASGGRDVGAVAAWNPGAIANGASAISADINILDHRFQIGDPVKVMAPYDLQGCTATAYVKSAASDTLDGSNFITGQTPAVVKIVITNATGGSITFADGTWVVLADNVRR
ncbi:NosD domain-containing protein [Methylosinus sp. sav-2]|uniref:NosD domain-containing protein n=1 Tax=Methylosinus sp. sav-2 TaxID=2485168 RepID=UPI001416EE52|nr:NosD domain-containing protein [Methylosinus sp. sav-2]